jgi:hypothetical protein
LYSFSKNTAAVAGVAARYGDEGSVSSDIFGADLSFVFQHAFPSMLILDPSTLSFPPSRECGFQGHFLLCVGLFWVVFHFDYYFRMTAPLMPSSPSLRGAYEAEVRLRSVLLTGT